MSSEGSDRMMLLLQELAEIKKEDDSGGSTPASEKRRSEISYEIKQLGLQKKESKE